MGYLPSTHTDKSIWSRGHSITFGDNAVGGKEGEGGGKEGVGGATQTVPSSKFTHKQCRNYAMPTNPDADGIDKNIQRTNMDCKKRTLF